MGPNFDQHFFTMEMMNDSILMCVSFDQLVVSAENRLHAPLPLSYLILSQFGFGTVTLEDQQTSGCIQPSPPPPLLTNLIIMIFMITFMQ